jgi:hypothetical protein
MTSFHRLTALKAITLGAALSMTAGLALAGDNNVSTDQILSALQPKPLTRGLSAGPQIDPSVKAKEIGFVQTIRNRKTRSLSMGEREEIAEIASTKPKFDLDIQFDYNSADISASSLPAVQSLGQALSNANLKGTRPSSSPATPMRSAEKPSTRACPSAAPIRSRNIWSTNSASPAATSSPSATARTSRRIRTRRWTRSTVASRSSTWIPRPRRNDGHTLTACRRTAGGPHG